ncbi:MAG: kelch repeat-containing protein [Myxococcota bacterium]
MTRITAGSVCVLIALGCGDDASPAADAGSDASDEIAWTAPSSLTLGEGERRTLDVPAATSNGSAIVAEAMATGVEVSVQDGGVRIYAPYESTAGSVDVTLRSDTDEVRATIPVTVDALSWAAPLSAERATPGPEEREHPALILDESNDRLLVFTGSGYAPYGTALSDVWALDLESGAWSQPAIEGTLPEAGSQRVARIEGESIAYLFGGYGQSFAILDNLYRVDFGADPIRVEEVTQESDSGATRRSLHAFVHDPETDTFWTFGGFGSTPRNDLRKMQIVDGVARWTFVETDSAPSDRFGFFYGFDSESGQLVLFSGDQGSPGGVDAARDVWALNVRSDPPTWTLLLEGDAAAPGRRNGVFAWDPRGPRLWIFGGTADAMTSEPGLWALDITDEPTFRELPLVGEPPLRSSGVGIYDPTRNRILLGFGNTTEAIYADIQVLQTGN